MSAFNTLDGRGANDLVNVELLEEALLEVSASAGESTDASASGANGGIASVTIPDAASFVTRDLFAISGRVAVSVYFMVEETITGEEGAVIGPELIVNGGFVGNADGWTLNTGWTYGSNNVVHTPGGGTSLVQDGPGTPISAMLELQLTTTGTAGQFSVAILGVEFGTFDSISGAITTRHEVNFEGTFITISPADGACDATITNISVRETAPNATLQIGLSGDDGDDDWFATRDVAADPLLTGTLFTDDTVSEGDEVSLTYTYLNGANNPLIQLNPIGTILTGAMTVFAQWYPLETGATVTVAE